jgi:hypothetical protein
VLPFHISAEVLEVENVIVTSQLRNKLKFLRHFPEDSWVKFVEIDMTNGLVPQSIYQSYAADIDARCARREKRKEAFHAELKEEESSR